jgi:hypothetical protein
VDICPDVFEMGEEFAQVKRTATSISIKTSLIRPLRNAL